MGDKMESTFTGATGEIFGFPIAQDDRLLADLLNEVTNLQDQLSNCNRRLAGRVTGAAPIPPIVTFDFEADGLVFYQRITATFELAGRSRTEAHDYADNLCGVIFRLFN